jgi:hypothetical protein
MIDAGFKGETQTAWHAGVAGFIAHRGTTLNCVFIADVKSYRLLQRIRNARTDCIATDIQEKIKMEGKKKIYAENKRRRKESTEERNKPHNIPSSRILCSDRGIVTGCAKIPVMETALSDSAWTVP